MKHINILIFLVLFSSLTIAHDYVPAPPQSNPILLQNGTVFTISNGTLQATDLLFENGRISEIGKNLTPPENCHIIDVTGKNIYPGFIAPNSTLGLIEIGQVTASKDNNERGRNNADVQTHIAYNPDSELIPSVRATGVTTALIVPSGSLIAGRSSLINLDGWTKEDAMEKENLALHISWPSMRIITAWWMEKSSEEQKIENEENLKQIFSIFENAKAYYLAKKTNAHLDLDSRFEAMAPLFDKSLMLFIRANSYTQINSAIDFALKFDLNIVIVGGTDSWKISAKLKKFNIPVILSRVQSLPSREDEDYDLRYKLPSLLLNDSVDFCLSYGSYFGTRNLPFQAAQTVGFGLSIDQALRSITLSTAEILGVSDDLGSLEIGKKATLIVSDGDVLNHKTHKIIYEFIEGRPVDLNNKHKELYEKYKQKTLY